MMMFSNLQLLRDGFVLLMYSRFFTLWKRGSLGLLTSTATGGKTGGLKTCGLEICSAWIQIKAGIMLDKDIQGGDVHNIPGNSSRSFQSYLHLISFSPEH